MMYTLLTGHSCGRLFAAAELRLGDRRSEFRQALALVDMLRVRVVGG